MGEIYSAKCGAEKIFEPVSDQSIAAFEEMIGERLPEDYRNFLVEWNGVRFYVESFPYAAAFPTQPVDDHSDHVPSWSDWDPSSRRNLYDSINNVTLLYGVGEDPRFALSKTIPGYDFELWAPTRFLAIGEPAYDIGRICISLAKYDRGQIYEWTWPEEKPEPGINCPNMDYFAWVAPDFKEFWDILRPMSTAEIGLWKPFGPSSDDEEK